MEQLIQLSKIDIIKETVEYYKNNPRSKDEDGFCLYNGKNNAKCAFSRCCTEDSVFSESDLPKRQLNAILLPKYQHLSISKNCDFWKNIQIIHDEDSYWEGNIFTKKGEDFVSKLIKEYS